MAYRRIALVFGAAALGLAVACGSDPKPTEPCRDGRPDFELLITAPGGPLPADLVVHVEYGGGEEEYSLASPGTQAVLFCDPSDREGNVIDAGTPSGGDAGAFGREAGTGGEGGAHGEASAQALFCRIWSFGAARIEVETMAYPTIEPLELTPEKGVCTGKEELQLSMPDAGT
jgi:hypothetical protein